MINVRDADSIRAARPFLVAHRGGVVTKNAPENSRNAIALAAEHGYAMVEIDVVGASDDEPVLMHDPLYFNCGVDKDIRELTSRELTALCYRCSDQHVLTLAQALEQCVSLNLGVMLDFKLERDGATGKPVEPAVSCVRRVAALLDTFGLTSSSVTISDTPGLRQYLGKRVLFPMRRDEPDGEQAWQREPGGGEFWFDWALKMPNEGVARLRAKGVLTIVSINVFQYPKHAHEELAGDDIRRLMAAGIDGLQIDSIYEPHARTRSKRTNP